ncbi:flagellar basal body rod protein FlgB [Microvirga tunisiensis]|uniref:Flagellar basal body rod protein FlgB n=2 Tax=Pannonibacter tanglangensis TaxID=2750084 RepID=A0A7X5F1Q8_9HYPH|nr:MULTISPECIES: flagellar basal body rod protein FlgB [unclassified Pannonibacter]NBN63548.1 flagellar basal body rod protein FlgB [Pannonibacter sp. XCT-34]NBN77185.1 flagellar basal body rod protein FlgB [Pannonibacter sp. XCT-53]
MALSDLSMFRALKSKMHWHQSRQSVLSENVANADTPGYRAKDMKAFDLDKLESTGSEGLSTARTQASHLQGFMSASSNRETRIETFEITPDGNSVSLEEQMMMVTANQMDYQAVTTLYTKSIGLIRTALGKTA